MLVQGYDEVPGQISREAALTAEALPQFGTSAKPFSREIFNEAAEFHGRLHVAQTVELAIFRRRAPRVVSEDRAGEKSLVVQQRDAGAVARAAKAIRRARAVHGKDRRRAEQIFLGAFKLRLRLALDADRHCPIPQGRREKRQRERRRRESKSRLCRSDGWPNHGPSHYPCQQCDERGDAMTQI